MAHITPVFLFSLPRSGSTMVQRVLGAHDAVSTTPEPWFLLPLLYTSRTGGVYTDYYHREYVKALEDFCRRLPSQQDYVDAIRDFALHLYTKASSSSARYFLDKTPRYHLIAMELMETFPESKVIFLWRNPLAVVSSIMKTWAEGRWNLYRYKIDLFTGQANLIATFQSHLERSLTLQYESLLTDPDPQWTRLFDYLGLDYHPSLLDSLAQRTLSGRMGDHAGTGSYDGLAQEPLGKWKSLLQNPLRKRWARRYLAWLGAERLEVMGYQMEDLLSALEDVDLSGRFLVSDIFRMSKGALQPWIEPELLRDKLRMRNRHSIVAHG